MFYVLWSLLNIALFIYFILICFKATKLVREKTGLFASLVFAFGLLSFIGPSNNDSYNQESNSNEGKIWKFISEDSIDESSRFPLDIVLQDNIVSKYHLLITCGKDKYLKTNIPINAYSPTFGLTGGTNWKPLHITVERTNNNNKFNYLVEGIVEWQLLGATIYTQLKRYDGFAISNHQPTN